MNLIDQIRKKKLITAIKTPYLPNGKIDLKTYDDLLQRQINFGIDGIIVGGTTGEGHLMNWDEHIMLIAHSINQFGNELYCIGNTGSNNTEEAVHATEQGFAVGMHASLQINPYYGKTSIAGVLQHFKKTLDIGPTIIYNVPSRTGQDILPEIMLQLAQHSNFVGVKECTGLQRIESYEQQNIPCWSGNDDEAFEGVHNYNSHGVISVTSNIVPSLMRTLMDENNPNLNSQLAPLFKWLFQEPNPIPLNTLLSMMKLIRPVFRLPYTFLELEERKLGIDILKSLHTSELSQNFQVLEDQEFIVV